MPRVGVRYSLMKVYGEFRTDLTDLRRYEPIIVETRRGQEIGELICYLGDPRGRHSLLPATALPIGRSSRGGDHDGDLVRRVTSEDRARLDELRAMEVREETRVCRELIDSLRLSMRLVQVERLFSGDKLVFYFVADERVDFRQLVRDLARRFHQRIEMKQIGVRDEAKLKGDVSSCGLTLCCNTFLKRFEPITMRMAKNQKSSLDPASISGVCGRLLCCLAYEDAQYIEMRKEMPPRRSWVRTEDAQGRVIATDLLSGRVLLETGEGERVIVQVGALTAVDPGLDSGQEPRREREFSDDSPREDPPRARRARPERRDGPAAKPEGARRGAARLETRPTTTEVLEKRVGTVRVAGLTFAEGRLSWGTAAMMVVGDAIARYHRAHGQTVSMNAEVLDVAPAGVGIAFRGRDHDQALLRPLGLGELLWERAHESLTHAAAVLRTFQERGLLTTQRFEGWFCPVCERAVEGLGAEAPQCRVCRHDAAPIDEDQMLFTIESFRARMAQIYKRRNDSLAPRAEREAIRARLEQPLPPIALARRTNGDTLALPGHPGFELTTWFSALAPSLGDAGEGAPDQGARIHLISREALWVQTFVLPALCWALGLKSPDHWICVGKGVLRAREIPKAGAPVDAAAKDPCTPEAACARFLGDAVRYIALREGAQPRPEGITWERCAARINHDLVGDLGNAYHRVATMVVTHLEGHVPQAPAPAAQDDIEALLLDAALGAADAVANAMATGAWYVALDRIWELVRTVNRFGDRRRPWALIKSEETRPQAERALALLAEAVRIIGVLLEPFLPSSAAVIAACFPTAGAPERPLTERAAWGQLDDARVIAKPPTLFEKALRKK